MGTGSIFFPWVWNSPASEFVSSHQPVTKIIHQGCKTYSDISSSHSFEIPFGEQLIGIALMSKECRPPPSRLLVHELIEDKICPVHFYVTLNWGAILAHYGHTREPIVGENNPYTPLYDLACSAKQWVSQTGDTLSLKPTPV